MKHTINFILFLVTTVQLASCQNNKDMNKKYKWEEGKSCPLGYPIEVYRGGFSTKEDNFVSLYGGITTGTGYWGEPDSGMSDSEKTLPNHLHVQWLSYVEDAMFEVDTDIDQEKIAAYFREGYKRRGASGKIRHENFDQIIAGFAPGGVVVVWVGGAGTQIEIGRYQGQKVVIPQSEIDALDYPDKILFDKEHRKETLEDPGIIPLEVQKANKDKPIPYGLWDTYRIRYHWQPIFEIQNEGTMGDFGFLYLNGEMDNYFYETNNQSKKTPGLFYQIQTDTTIFPIPREIAFDWKDKNMKRYSGFFEFNEQEILNAFEKICGQDKAIRIEMLIRINIPNTYATVQLRGSNGKEAYLTKHKEDIFYKIKE